MASDITNTILDTLIDVFTLNMSAGVDDADELQLISIQKYPFQEDPTEVASFIWVAPSLERGRIDDPVHEDDIGGGVRWLNFFHIRGRIPQQFTKEDAYRKLGIMNRRAIQTLRANWDLSGVTADDGETVTFCAPRCIDENITKVFGGEVEWFGEFRIDCHFFTEESPSDWG